MHEGSASTERSGPFAVGLTAALVAGLWCLQLTSTQAYPEFVVGQLAGSASSKLGDLLFAPAVIAAIVLGYSFAARATAGTRCPPGEAFDSPRRQLLLFSLPAFAAIAALVLGQRPDLALMQLCLCMLAFQIVAQRWAQGSGLRPVSVSLLLLTGLAVGLLPFELKLLLGRAPLPLASHVHGADWSTPAFALSILGLSVATLLTRHTDRATRALPHLLLLAQIGVPLLYLCMLPARLVTADGSMVAYPVAWPLRALVAALVVGGVLDVARRYLRQLRQPSLDAWHQVSPLTILALLLVFRAGGTTMPSIDPDDYHFGESLLGWWSYMQGKVPYVQYIPPHGIVADDLTAAIAGVFFDGQVGSYSEAARLSFVLLLGASFFSVRRLTGSTLLAFAGTFFAGGRATWLVLIPVLCLWLDPALRRHPWRWLAAWMLSAPLLVLALPPQGLPLIAASGLLVLHMALCALRSEPEWRWPCVALAILVGLAIATPFLSMLYGAVTYVLENAPLNQVAYGIPWANSWGDGHLRGFDIELIRMSWMLVPVACVALMTTAWRGGTATRSHLPAIALVGLFLLLLVPYSMGRIDPASLSRPGMISAFALPLLLPMVAWPVLQASHRVPMVVAIAAVCSLLNTAPISLQSLRYASTPLVQTELDIGQSHGIPGIGLAAFDAQHLARLKRVSATLDGNLAPGAPYLDMTSRNAQYVYMRRPVPTSVSAPYNTVSAWQQHRSVSELRANIPDIALLTGDSLMFDGVGPALRSPLLYRFVMDTYVPDMQNGLVIGRRVGTEPPSSATLELSAVNDSIWIDGVHRTEPAVVLADPQLSWLFTVGTHVSFADGTQANVTGVDGAVIRLDARPRVRGAITVPLPPESLHAYRLALWDKAFRIDDLGMIPVAWGQSFNSLRSQLVDVVKLAEGRPNSDLQSKNGELTVTGDDPLVIFDISGLNVSGDSKGMLSFDLRCASSAPTVSPRVQVFWWGDDQAGPSEAASVRFDARNGTMVVPLDASPRWLTTKHVKALRIDLDRLGDGCRSFRIKDVALSQRRGA